MECVDNCPVNVALRYIGKKWSIGIVKDLFFGKRYFTEFLESNPELSGKVLSERLKELAGNGIISKDIVSKSPLKIEYSLTEKGRKLNKVIFELAVFSMNACPNEVSKNECPRASMENLRKSLQIA